MKLGRVLAPIFALGPGRRIGLWFQGCSKDCPGCISPELQSFHSPDISALQVAEILINMAKQEKYHRLTISGGDPFEQSSELFALLQEVREFFDDIIVYTGYTYSEILSGICGNTGIECLSKIDVLIDGRYIENRNHADCILRGSDNQKIIFINQDIEKEYQKYLHEQRKIETFYHGDTVILVGIMNREENDGERNYT